MANIITIDGPSSSGKSSIGHLFSQEIGYQFIDTGAVYRVGSLLVLKNKINSDNEQEVAQVFEKLPIEFKTEGKESKIYLNKKDVTTILHSPEITAIVPKVAAYASVRSNAKKLQRKIGMEQNTIMAGRDIGTEIFPDSKLKFFITASPKVRAKRRFDQLVKKHPEIKIEQVLQQMIARDEMDSKREASPMRIPMDAVIIDTSDKNVEESVSMMLGEYNRVFANVLN